MRLDDVFHKLLQDRRLPLECDHKAAESLRVSLLRKFKDYREQTEKLGWFPEDLLNCTVSMELYKSEDKKVVLGAIFFLREKKRKEIEYKLLVLPGMEPAGSDSNDSDSDIGPQNV